MEEVGLIVLSCFQYIGDGIIVSNGGSADSANRCSEVGSGGGSINVFAEQIRRGSKNSYS